MKNLFRKINSRLVDIWRTLGLVWKITPFWTSAKVVLVLIQGLLPLAALYLMKQIVDAVSDGIQGSDAPDTSQLFFWISLAGGVALLIIICNSLSQIVAEAQNFYVTETMSDRIHEQSALLDLAHYENSAYHDTVHRAQAEAPTRPLAILNSMTQVAQSAVSVLGVGGLLLAYNAPLTLTLIVFAVPGALVRLVFARKNRDLQKKQTPGKRLAQFYHIFLTYEMPAKELKLFNLGEVFRQRYLKIKKALRSESVRILRQRTLADVLAQGIATVALFVCLALIARAALIGAITLGAMVMYYQAFQTGLSKLNSLMQSSATLFEHSLFLEYFYQFLNLKPGIVPHEPVQKAPVPIQQGIRLENLSFSYYGRDEKAVSEVNIEIRPGQVIALVGANGSGKSTIAKLLGRLYDPSDGRITVDGIDLRNLKPADWRRNVSAVFQDYLRYPLTVKDNICLGDVERDASMEAIEEAAYASGAEPLIKRLRNGYDTMLGNAFHNGQELSGGEWQKIAVARAYFRRAQLVILDEPTSALDPLAEMELFNRFKQLVEGRSAVLISHRYSTVQMADYIYVLDQGKVIEKGTHAELLEMDAVYAQFYHAQAEKFLKVV